MIAHHVGFASSCSRALLVIAHPDDESMFFTPTIEHLHARSCVLSVLCLSTGNHYGIGKVRQRELVQACKLLGILTFDSKGVSQHPNHIAVWRGAVEYSKHNNYQLQQNSTLPPVPIFTLQTTGLLQKYSGPWALIARFFFSLRHVDATCISIRPLRAVRALQAHQSQFIWYRKLFIWLSSYSYVNSYSRLLP